MGNLHEVLRELVNSSVNFYVHGRQSHVVRMPAPSLKNGLCLVGLSVSPMSFWAQPVNADATHI